MKWLPDSKKYREACQNADLKTFKRNPNYVGIVGNDTRDYNTTKQFYGVVSHMDYCSENDKLGNPVLHEIDGKKVSCGTLRYMKVKNDLSRWDYKSVVEIGGGYGGQRLVMRDVKDYTIIDLECAIDLSRDYLYNVDNSVHTGFVDTDMVSLLQELQPTFDLCISDYALCEFDEELMDFYIESVVKNCKYGYFTVNMNFDMLEKKLSKYFDLEIVEENPRTSKHLNKIYYAELLHSNV